MINVKLNSQGYIAVLETDLLSENNWVLAHLKILPTNNFFFYKSNIWYGYKQGLTLNNQQLLIHQKDRKILNSTRKSY